MLKYGFYIPTSFSITVPKDVGVEKVYGDSGRGKTPSP
jgi:hypothetical protein